MGSAVDWSALGLDVHQLTGQFPDVAGTCFGACIVVGGGRCVWDDLARLGYDSQRAQYSVMCVNDIYMHFDGAVDHFYSNDGKFMPNWLNARRELIRRDYDGQRRFMTHSNIGGAKYRWPWPGHGTSSLNAVYTALALGYDRVILCGVPLDDSGHYFDPPWRKTNFSREVADTGDGPRYWARQRPLLKGRVFSMSGRTRDLLGEPPG